MKSEKMKTRNVKSGLKTLQKTACLLLFSTLVCSGCTSNTPAGEKKPDLQQEETTETAFLRIDGVEIPEDVFTLLLRDQKSIAINRFLPEGEEVSDSFWTTEVDGTTPLDWSREQAVEQAAQLAALINMAADQNILNEADLSSLMEGMDDENENRSKAKDEGDVVYGNTSFTPQTWLEYVRTGLKQELLKAYETSRTYSDAELLELYDENPDLFSTGTVIQLTLVYPGGKSEEVSLSEAEIGKEESAKQELFEQALECSPGDLLENVPWNDQTISVVVGKTTAGSRDDFDSVKDQLVSTAARKAFESDLQEKAGHAKIEKNEEAFNSVQMS